MRLTDGSSERAIHSRASDKGGSGGAWGPLPPGITMLQVDIPQEAFLAVLRVDE
jgi:hypothetical protein